MFRSISDNWPSWFGMILLALGFAVFQYFFIPISIGKDARGHYVHPTSFLHGSNKIQGVAQEFCSQTNQSVINFRMSSKSMGGERNRVFRFDCGLTGK